MRFLFRSFGLDIWPIMRVFLGLTFAAEDFKLPSIEMADMPNKVLRGSSVVTRLPQYPQWTASSGIELLQEWQIIILSPWIAVDHSLEVKETESVSSRSKNTVN